MERARTRLPAVGASQSAPALRIHVLAYSSCGEPDSGGIRWPDLWDVSILPLSTYRLNSGSLIEMRLKLHS